MIYPVCERAVKRHKILVHAGLSQIGHIFSLHRIMQNHGAGIGVVSLLILYLVSARYFCGEKCFCGAV